MQIHHVNPHRQPSLGLVQPVRQFFGRKEYVDEYKAWLNQDVFKTPMDFDLMMLVRSMNNVEPILTSKQRKARHRDPHDVFALWMTEKDSTLFKTNAFLQPQPHWMRFIQKMVPTQNNPMAQFFPGVVKFNNELRQLLVVAKLIPPVAVKMAPKRYALDAEHQEMEKLEDEEGNLIGPKIAKFRLKDLRKAITIYWEEYQTKMRRSWNEKERELSFEVQA